MVITKIKFFILVMFIVAISFGSGIVSDRFIFNMDNQEGRPTEKDDLPMEKSDFTQPQAENLSDKKEPQEIDQIEEEKDIISKNDLLDSEVKKQPISEKKIKASDTKGIQYRNEKFSFKMTLPLGWDEYKADEKKDRIEISLPSKDDHYVVGNGDSDGRSPVVDIWFWTKNDWAKYLEGCVKDPSPNCFVEESITDKNDKYVFIVSTSSSILPDIKSFDSKKYFLDFIKESFEAI